MLQNPTDWLTNHFSSLLFFTFPSLDPPLLPLIPPKSLRQIHCQ